MPRFIVRYKPTGAKMQDFDAPVVAGIHGVFVNHTDADAAAQRCLDFFNKRTIVEKSVGGDMQEHVVASQELEKQVVTVWIEEEDACAQSSAATENAPRTGLTENKSAKSGSTKQSPTSQSATAPA